MNKEIALVLFTALAESSGNPAIAKAIALITTAAEAGADIDAHMQSVADALANGDDPDLDDLQARIEAESDRLHRD